MEKFDGYDEAQAYGSYERLKLGGHICKIIDVMIEKYTTKEQKVFEQLVLKIDIAEPDEQAGFYNRKFALDAEKDAMKAKWKGFYKLSIPKNDSEDFIKSTFKTFTTSVEKSNPGYKWNWEEKQLIGKVFGGVFGIEEFVNDKGDTIAFTRCRFVRSTEKINEIEIPKVRLADKSLMDYNEYIEKKKAERANNSNSSETANPLAGTVTDEDLPF